MREGKSSQGQMNQRSWPGVSNRVDGAVFPLGTFSSCAHRAALRKNREREEVDGRWRTPQMQGPPSPKTHLEAKRESWVDYRGC